jgi:hypothetical protein
LDYYQSYEDGVIKWGSIDIQHTVCEQGGMLMLDCTSKIYNDCLKIITHTKKHFSELID